MIRGKEFRERLARLKPNAHMGRAIAQKGDDQKDIAPFQKAGVAQKEKEWGKELIVL